MPIRWRMLIRIVLRLPSLTCLRCIPSLHLTAECGREQFPRNEDYVTRSRGQTLSGIGAADRGVPLAAPGKPLGNVPERLSFDARAAGDDVPPSLGGGLVAREERRDDLLLQL